MKKNQNFGNPLYNLRINLLLKKTTFEVNDSNTNDLLYIEELSDISKFCKNHLQGYHLVTDLGFLLKSWEIDSNKNYDRFIQSNFPFYDVTLEINQDVVAMHRLKDAFDRKHDSKNENLVALLSYNEDFTQALYTKSGRIYLPVNDFNLLKSNVKVA